jgi:LPXTG-motif cell wall-anchored protein
MRKTRLLIPALALALLGALTVVSSSSAQQPVTVNIGPGRDEATGTGTATLTDMGGGQTQVVVRVAATNPDMPAHIHADACPGVGAVVFPLTNVQNGTSTTTISAPLSDVLTRGRSVNLHRSAQEIGVYVGCANLPATAAAPAQMPGALPRTGDLGGMAPLLIAAGTGLVGAGYMLRRRGRR